jgi:hypothetical protein
MTMLGQQFLGIPYAAPPVGNLRWMPPQPVTRWGDPLDATSGAEIVSFQVTNMPNTGCPTGTWFFFDPTDVTDAQTRKNLLTTLFAAKLSGATVNVVYSSTVCDSASGYAIPIALIMS